MLDGRTTLTRWIAALCLGTLAACGSAGPVGPLDTTRSWFQAVVELDMLRVKSLACRPDSAAIDDALTASGGLGGNLDLSELQARVEIDLSQLHFAESSVDGEQAVVHLSGLLNGAPVEQDVRLIREDGVWKVCTTDLPEP